jgi:hypothetical protein
MEAFIILVFIGGYIAIAFEHSIKINKSASAILTGVICWSLFILSSPADTLLSSPGFVAFLEQGNLSPDGKFAIMGQHELFVRFVTRELSLHLAQISEILFFLIGAMTIVELIDAHQGFRLITDRIKTRNVRFWSG